MIQKKTPHGPEQSAGSFLPRCVGIVMDGNRRWARAHYLPTFEGHRRGYLKLKKLIEWAREVGIAYVLVYAFSTENWKRTTEEVGYLMNLFRTMIDDLLAAAIAQKTRIIFIGERGRFAQDLVDAMNRVEETTKAFSDLVVGVALSYGGRAELITAIRLLSCAELARLDEKLFAEKLWTKDFPDPDMIIRTSGEKRLSGFLPWQSVYSELFFTDTLWPAFSKKEFLTLLRQFHERKRRHGL